MIVASRDNCDDYDNIDDDNDNDEGAVRSGGHCFFFNPKRIVDRNMYC